MKSKILQIIVSCILLVVTVVNIVFFIRSSFFYSMSDLPEGSFMYSVMSPDGEKTLKLFSVDIEGIGIAVRGEIVENKLTNNVFWQTGTSTAIATWIDGNVININGKSIDIYKNVYDSRKQIELPSASVKGRMNSSD